MKQSPALEPSLKALHWDGLANLHLELCYCRRRFIQSVNQKVAAGVLSSVESLNQLAKVDDLLQDAADRLETAKLALFDLCYDAETVSAAANPDRLT